eukprot:2095259-Heterocapsa_arctica.AAC.1
MPRRRRDCWPMAEHARSTRVAEHGAPGDLSRDGVVRAWREYGTARAPREAGPPRLGELHELTSDATQP